MEEQVINVDLYRAWRNIYTSDPIHGLLILIFEDLAKEGLQNNITISSIEGQLPTRLTVIPDWLKGEAKLLFDRIVQILFFEDMAGDWTFCVVLDSGLYLYVNHYEGSGNYDCCQTLHIYYSNSWEILKPHIAPRHIPSKSLLK